MPVKRKISPAYGPHSRGIHEVNKNRLRKRPYAILVFGAVIVLLWVVFYMLTVRIIRKNMESQARAVVESIMNDVGNELLLMDECASIIADNKNVINIVNSGSREEFCDLGSYARELFEPVLSTIVNADAVVIYDGDGMFYRLKGEVSDAMLNRAFSMMEEGGKAVAVSSGDENYMGIIEEIEAGNGCAGYVLLLMEQQKVENLLSIYNDIDYIGTALFFGDSLFCSGAGLSGDALAEKLKDAVYFDERYVGLSGYRIVVYCTDPVPGNLTLFFRIALPVIIIVLTILGFIFKSFMSAYVDAGIELELERTGLTLLKKQISAHFTVNTLNIIRALIGKGDREAASGMCSELSVLLRYANASDEYITLLEEFYVLEQYTGIMQTRYPGRINARIEEDDSFSKILVPRMLIQPIVENAIMYGLGEGSGTLSVTAVTEGKDLFIKVSDDGKGMTESELQKVRNEMYGTEAPGHGGLDHIALSNVRKRIRALFGEKYGIDIVSDAGKGTEVTLHLPLIEAGNEKMISGFHPDVLSSDKKRKSLRSENP